jgi:D-glycero-D-manno-heptose 1,7-bisphosphate phosphatase
MYHSNRSAAAASQAEQQHAKAFRLYRFEVDVSRLDPHPIRYVFLDRDGVLNRKMPEGVYVTGWHQFDWLPGAEDAIARMNRSGIIVILVTNQRAIALGKLSEAGLNEIHAKMRDHLARHNAHMDAIFYCPHDRDQCQCRKPGTGLFEQAIERFPEANAYNSLVVGDSLSDIQAGKQMGMKTVFIAGDPARQKPGAATAAQDADAVASSLLDAVESYLGLGSPAAPEEASHSC